MIFKQFSKKWGLHDLTVETIYIIIEQSGRKYSKTSRVLKGMEIKLSSRQLKYFYKKCILFNLLEIEKKGKPKNYSDLLRRNT